MLPHLPSLGLARGLSIARHIIGSLHAGTGCIQGGVQSTEQAECTVKIS